MKHFWTFLESIKTPNNSNVISAIEKAYCICFENEETTEKCTQIPMGKFKIKELTDDEKHALGEEAYRLIQEYDKKVQEGKKEYASEKEWGQALANKAFYVELSGMYQVRYMLWALGLRRISCRGALGEEPLRSVKKAIAYAERFKPLPPVIYASDISELRATFKNARIPFGKYRGIEWQDVLKTDPDYIRWFLEQGATYTKEAGRIAYQIKNSEDWKEFEASQEKESAVITFGKYKGKAAESLLEEDPGYISWLLKKYRQEMPSYIKPALRTFLEKNERKIKELSQQQNAELASAGGYPAVGEKISNVSVKLVAKEKKQGFAYNTFVYHYKFEDASANITYFLRTSIQTDAEIGDNVSISSKVKQVNARKDGASIILGGPGSRSSIKKI